MSDGTNHTAFIAAVDPISGATQDVSCTTFVDDIGKTHASMEAERLEGRVTSAGWRLNQALGERGYGVNATKGATTAMFYGTGSMQIAREFSMNVDAEVKLEARYLGPLMCASGAMG